MNIILLMIPISLLLSLGFLGAFFWSTKKGQFNHIDLESQKILNEENEN
jgi:cbb3-type cytochrome oxidase maturation protein